MLMACKTPLHSHQHTGWQLLPPDLQSNVIDELQGQSSMGVTQSQPDVRHFELPKPDQVT